MRKSLNAFSHFFVEDENSEELLKNIHLQNVTISGDTRFDRVFEITKQNNILNFITEFKMFINDFEPVKFAQFPALKKIKEELLDEGAFYASMTGSGSAIFGLYLNPPTMNKKYQFERILLLD